MQDDGNSTSNALVLLQSYTKPSIWSSSHKSYPFKIHYIITLTIIHVLLFPDWTMLHKQCQNSRGDLRYTIIRMLPSKRNRQYSSSREPYNRNRWSSNIIANTHSINLFSQLIQTTIYSTKFCTCHDDSAVMVCLKIVAICMDSIATNTYRWLSARLQ